MRKRNRKILAAGAALLMVSGYFPLTGQAANAIEEKPLAGITLSLDRYCESVLENARKEEQKAQEESGGGDSGEGKTTVTSNVPDKEQKEKEERIKLNLKYQGTCW